ncbi:hypothetical protein [Pelagibacterium halotolerans]|uniref:Additional component NikL of nickel ECF transporter n=1 Tax=Pelagibacterium halotolerans (strain DSM 22347 / JCM 15775 / CGMCC 1.7692 / B2) TaxID=1082931 RepID=G4R724_PELHB|nr:hypothetical protein [Pelagibacterium halotolerans]AEQ50178.1 hypothetical protein KKY_131 [Pelagibacterium halotolerans B2]QJR19814.1 cobalt ABC transporter permease [Pelagibacterium halotolerans]SEA49862.1 nickel transport protein [Pelagibacterium halotolerans]
MATITKHLARKICPVLVVAVTMTSPVLAHNLILEAYPYGADIAGEAFFSDGVMVGESVIDILGPDGERIGEVLTDEYGSFSYTPTGDLDLTFRLDAGAGHVAEATVAAGTLVVPEAAGGSGEQEDVSSAGLDSNLEAALAAAIREQLRPIRQDLVLYSAQSSYPVVLGGLGYIVGLTGLGFFVMARRRRMNT